MKLRRTTMGSRAHESALYAADTLDGDTLTSSECSVRQHHIARDELCRLRSVSITTTEPNWYIGANPAPLARSFDLIPDDYGNFVHIDGPNGVTETRTYDEANRLHTIAIGQTTQATYTYYPDGLPESATYANGTSTAWTCPPPYYNVVTFNCYDWCNRIFYHCPP